MEENTCLNLLLDGFNIRTLEARLNFGLALVLVPVTLVNSSLDRSNRGFEPSRRKPVSLGGIRIHTKVRGLNGCNLMVAPSNCEHKYQLGGKFQLVRIRSGFESWCLPLRERYP
jgi:hypothetical protein